MSEKIIKAINEGVIELGNKKIPCAVLEDGTRLLTQQGFLKAIGRARTAKGGQGASVDKSVAFLAANNLKRFISQELEESTRPIQFKTVRGNKAYGYKAELLPQVCEVYLKARDEKELHSTQLHIAQTADMLMRGLAHIGIIALVDEATGYQEIRDRKALQAILDKFLRKELAAWAKTFPDEFYQQIFRLKGWQWRGMKVNRPSVVGKYTQDIVYERIAPGLLKELEKKNPRKPSGERVAKHHQWLTENIGHPALAQHLHAVIGLMRASASWSQFHRMLQRAFPKKEENIPLLLDE